MSPGNLSRIETGYQGPPSDETIERLAAVLEVDVAELLAVAGRSLDREAFEQRVLKELRALRVELRAGLDRIETALGQGPERR
jgi:transcriptional regulator with XRE-family HTH domain